MVCLVRHSSQLRCSSTTIAQSNECKWVMKKASSTPRYFHVVHLGCKMGVFELVFKDWQQSATSNPKVLARTPWVKAGIQVAQNDRRVNAHPQKRFSCRFCRLARSMANLVSKNGHFWGH